MNAAIRVLFSIITFSPKINYYFKVEDVLHISIADTILFGHNLNKLIDDNKSSHIGHWVII